MTMLLSVPSMMLVVSFILVLVICPLDVQALFGIPDFLEMGDCSLIPPMKDFDQVKYSGLWFDIESVPNEYQYTKKCITQNYTWAGDYMNVATRGLTTEDKKVRQGAIMRVDASVSPPNPAHMTVEASGVPAAPYKIISSDYRTYSCVYSCLEYFGFRAEFFWIFSRKPTLPAEKIRLCHRTFKNFDIDYQKMFPIIQGEPCPYYEKLSELLNKSDQHLLKVLGPYVPSSSAPTPVPAITTTIDNRYAAVEQELKDIKKMVQEERNIIQEVEAQLLHNSAEILPNETAKSSERFQENTEDKKNVFTAKSSERLQEHTQDTNSASLSAISVILLLMPLFMTAVLHQWTK